MLLLILLDDAGFGTNSTFGGVIPTPTLDKLAANGLRYHQSQLDRALLADAGGIARRPQPSLDGLWRNRRDGDWFPRL